MVVSDEFRGGGGGMVYIPEGECCCDDNLAELYFAGG